MQWLALRCPYAMDVVKQFVTSIMDKRRRRLLDASLTFDPSLRYIAAQIHDPQAVLSPDDRIGKYAGDVLPSYAMESLDRCLYEVKHTDAPQGYVQHRPDGSSWHIAVFIPNPAVVVCNIARALPIATKALLVLLMATSILT